MPPSEPNGPESLYELEKRTEKQISGETCGQDYVSLCGECQGKRDRKTGGKRVVENRVQVAPFLKGEEPPSALQASIDVQSGVRPLRPYRECLKHVVPKT
jgi:hypothetical protein